MAMKMTIGFFDGPSGDVESDPVGVEISATFRDVANARSVAFEAAELPAIRTQVRSLIIKSQDGAILERWQRTKDGWAPEAG
jgi:hypothetical protein